MIHNVQLSDQEIAGQMFMLGFDGDTLNEELKYLIREMKIGGIILFSRNMPGSPQNPEQIRQLCQSAQEYAESCGLPRLLISTDQEGGKVARLKEPFAVFPGNPSMSGQQDAENFGRITASELKSVGINMNLAPVLDVAIGDGIMSDRAFAGDAHQVSRMGAWLIESLQSDGIMAVGKHFPGIGRTVIDSHLDLPSFDASKADMDAIELLPFKTAIEHRVAGIMLSHILYTRLDSEFPASLSVKIVRDLLRNDMGYEGLVMTDDLDMGAVANHYDISTCIRQILLADSDIILICKQSPKVGVAYDEVLKHIRDFRSVRHKAMLSYRRIMGMKQRFGIQLS